METREMTCIVCPMGCRLTVTRDGDDINVTGNNCPRGAKYAHQEFINPMRTVTSSVFVSGGKLTMCSVKTANVIPKSMIPQALKAIRACRIEAPVAIGDVVIKDICSTGVDLVATRNVDKV